MPDGAHALIERVQKTLGVRKGETTICMVTHDEGYAHQAGRTVHLLGGRIVDDDEGW